MKTMKLLVVSSMTVGLLAMSGCSSTESQQADASVVKQKKAGLPGSTNAGCETAQARKKKRCRRHN